MVEHLVYTENVSGSSPLLFREGNSINIDKMEISV